MQDVKQILIKDDKGQFKTVDLSDDQVNPEYSGHAVAMTGKNKQTFIPPKFYFDVKDEEEASKFINKESEAVREKKNKLLQKKANLFLLDLKLDEQTLGQVQAKKIEKIIISYLRGIRTDLEFAEILCGDKNKNGFGFSREEVREIIKKLKNKKAFFEGINLDKIKEKEEIKKEEIKEKNIEKVDEVSVISNKEQQKIQKQEQVIQRPLARTQDIKPPEKKVYIQPEKKIITNLKINKKTKGPIEELQELNIQEFRNLGATAKERVNRIYNKINLLEQESIDKKTQGINSWKSSEVYKEYVLIGEEGLAQGKPIRDVIARQNNLSLDEFNAIADLNEQLNY